MKRTENVLTRFLLPLDIDGPHTQSLALMKCLASTLGQRVEKITLLHVMAGRYLSQHMANIDFRVQNIISTEKFKEIRQRYVDREILPVLEAAKKELENAGVRAPVDIVIDDGDPVQHVVDRATSEEYSTVILQRSGLSQVGDMFVGSVTSGILHREVRSAIALTGSRIAEEGCVPRCILVAMDESDNAWEALGKASVFARSSDAAVEQVILVHVLDLAECGEALSGGMVPKRSMDDLLDKAEAFLVERGIGEGKVSKISACGDPAEVLIDVINTQDVDVIFLGRRGRGAVKELFMGSVSRKIMYRCPEQAIMLANAD